MPKQYPAEIRERAVRLVREAQQHPDTSYGAPARIAQQLGINADTLRGWLKQADSIYCDHTGPLRHVTGFPGLGLLRVLRPTPARSAGRALSR